MLCNDLYCISEYPTLTSSTIQMSTFASNLSAASNRRGHGVGSSYFSPPFSYCPAFVCYRKSKCFCFTLIFTFIFIAVAIAYLGGSTFGDASSINPILSHNINNANMVTFKSQSPLSTQKNVEKKPYPAYYSNGNKLHQWILLNQGRGQLNSTNSINLINFTSIQQDGVEFKIDKDDVMVFLHIQKTGGTTFERHLVQDIDLEAPCTCRKKKRRKKGFWDGEGYGKKWFAGGCECFRPNTSSETSLSKSTWLFSRYNTGWKCGLHADWTELTECVDSYLDTEEGVTNRR